VADRHPVLGTNHYNGFDIFIPQLDESLGRCLPGVYPAGMWNLHGPDIGINKTAIAPGKEVLPYSLSLCRISRIELIFPRGFSNRHHSSWQLKSSTVFIFRPRRRFLSYPATPGKTNR
jgi:hypothetical protein